MPKVKIIANPVAGGGSARKKIPLVQSQTEKYHLEADLAITERPGHAIELARQAALDGIPIIVAAGGDGTVNEVINGIKSARQEGSSADTSPNLGVLCIGRGNDFAGSNFIPEQIEAGVQALLGGSTRTVDIGRVYGGLFPQGRYFGNCVGVGFDAMTTIQVSRMPRMGGFFSFFLAVLKTIFLYYQGPTLKIEYDDHSLTQASLLVSVMNGRRLGGGFWMAPDARSDDGLFDLCIADQVGRLEIFRMIPHFMKGTQASQPAIKTAQAKRISIVSLDKPIPAQTDGEILCVDGDRLEIEILPQQLRVIYQPGYQAPQPKR